MFIRLTLMIFLTTACSYRWGFRERAVPGGYTQIAIPIFKNTTKEVGLESDFTNALIRRFERSQVARVTTTEIAPVRIDGVVDKLEVVSGPGVQGGKSDNTLPQDAVLTSEYSLKLHARVYLRRQSDEKVIWQGDFEDQRNYQAPRIGEPVVNSANATYNQSARRTALAGLAEEMMQEAHDRITENF